MTLQELLDQAVSYMDTDPDKALEGFNYLINLSPNQAELVFFIATCQMNKKNFGVAENLFHRAIELKKDFAEAYNNLGLCFHLQGNVEKADLYFKEAVKHKPDNANMLNNIATCYVNNGTPDKALEILKEASLLEPDNPHIKWNKGLALLEKGEYQGGWAGYEAGIEAGHRKKREYHAEGTPLWEGTAGKSVVVFGEQGVGDEIMFASCIPDLMKDCDVIFEGHPRLTNIYKNSFDIPVYGTRKEEFISWHRHHDIDAKLPIGSLGKYYRPNKESFPKVPYIKADPKLVDECRSRFTTDKMKVVIHWKGGTEKTNMRYRSIPLLSWEPILKQDCEFISLQYTENAEKIAGEAENKFNCIIHHWQDIVDDMDYQTAMLKAADLVITVCTSIVHISGALGKECWCLTPSQCAWRYGLKRDQMDWYESVKLYRQSDGWEPLIEQVAIELKDKVDAYKRRLQAA